MDAKPDAPASVDEGRRPVRRWVRLPSAFIAITAGAVVAAAVASRWLAGGGSVFGVLGLTLAGGLTLIAGLALAELRSTAPFSGGAWHFARMVGGVQGGFLLAWLEVFAMAVTAGLLARAAHDAWRLLGDGWAGLTVGRAVLRFWLAGLPVAVPFVGWMSLTPHTRRPPSRLWRRLLKWLALCALTVGWGATGWFLPRAFGEGARFPAAPTALQGWSELVIGLLTGLALFGSVLHSVPGDTPWVAPQTRAGDETDEHRRYRLPRGIILGLLLAVLSATLLGLALAGGGGTAPVDRTALALAACVAAAGGACFAVARSVRTMSAIAREGMLPAMLARPDRDRAVQRRRTACAGILALAVGGAAATTFPTTEALAAAAGLLQALLGAATCFCQVRHRRELGDELDYGFVMPGFPWLPGAIGLVLLACAAGLATVHAATLLPLAVWGFSGALLHEFYVRTHSLARSEDIARLESDAPDDAGATDRHTLHVLAATADAATARNLLRLARRLCGRRPAQFGLLHMVTVPESVRIAEAARDLGAARAVVTTVVHQLAEERIAVRPSIRYGRSVSRGILTTVRESRTDLLLLGWHGRVRRGQDCAWGRTLDPVLRRASCNIAVAKALPDTPVFRRILVPLLDTCHSALALNVAARLVDQEAEGWIELFGVHGYGVGEVRAPRFLRIHARRVAGCPVPIHCRTEVCGSVVEGVLEEILRKHPDVVVMGATPPRQASDWTEGAVATRIAARCRIPCIMVAVAPRSIQWRNRWFA